MKPLEDSDDSDEEEEETFPFRFVGDVQKKVNYSVFLIVDI
jgi:hypothetical protein